MLARSRNTNRLNLDLSRVKVAFDYGSSRHVEPITPGARTAELATYHTRYEQEISLPISKNSARGPSSDSITERLRALWKLARIGENQDTASPYLMIRGDLADKRALEEINGVDRLSAPPNSATAPHPDSFPVEPAFMFTFTESGPEGEFEGIQSIVSGGQLIPVDVDEIDDIDAGPQSRFAVASPKLHPALAHIYPNMYSREIEPTNWTGFCQGYGPTSASGVASFLEMTEEASA